MWSMWNRAGDGLHFPFSDFTAFGKASANRSTYLVGTENEVLMKREPNLLLT